LTQVMQGSGQPLRCRIVVVLCFALCAIGVSAAVESPQGSIALVLPRAAAPNEAVWLHIRADVLPRGARLRGGAGPSALWPAVAHGSPWWR
jgi:hypothetical protein